jgi:hypothetical protein
MAGKLPTESQVQQLCLLATEILIDESNVQRLYAPITVPHTKRGDAS